MNQTQRKYALERIEEITNKKIKDWEAENPAPPSFDNCVMNGTINGGWLRYSDTKLDTIELLVTKLQSIIDVGFVPIDIDRARVALDKISTSVQYIRSNNASSHVSSFNIKDYIKIPDQVINEIRESLEVSSTVREEWEERRNAVVNRLISRKNALKDTVMLGSSSEALLALHGIEEFALEEVPQVPEEPEQ